MSTYQKIMELIETSDKYNAKEKIHKFISGEPRSEYHANADRYLLYSSMHGNDIGAVVLQSQVESSKNKISIQGAYVFDGLSKKFYDYDSEFDNFILALSKAFDV